MLELIRFIIWVLAEIVLSLRYKVTVVGIDKVKGMKRTLILPNHPAYVDPALTMKTVWRALRPRPMLFEGVFKNPFLMWIPVLLDAVKVPDLEHHSTQARQQAESSIDAIVEGLKRGDNHILWPAGRLYRQDHEELGGARALAEILARVPDANVVVVRHRGLWGSSFSHAYTGKHPKLTARLLFGVWVILANFIFFVPRRKVTITVEQLDRGKFPGTTREQLNPFFEAWYNQSGPEKATYYPYHFLFGPRTYVYPPLDRGDDVDLSLIKPDTKAIVAEILEAKLGRHLTEAERDPGFKLESLGLDSLDRMEISLSIEQRTGFSSDQVAISLGDLWALAQGLTAGGPSKPVPESWFAKSTGDMAVRILGPTIPEALVRRSMLTPGDVLMADDMSGVVTYERFLTGALIMSRHIASDVKAPNVGLMLPASVATDMLFCALHLCGKLPVILNWTTGPGNLAHAAKTMGLTHVITSSKFVDRTGTVVEGVEFLFVEDIKSRIGKFEALTTLLKVRYMPGSVLSALPRTDPEKPAVVLFTSGSEKAPKAVPLTHRNLLSNLQSAMDGIPFSRHDTMLGFLPAFHSFGISVTSLLPIVSGLRVVHHPDPTDSFGLARKLTAYKATLVCGTPTFVSYILERGKPGEFVSLRLIVVGAEKCPPALFERVKLIAPNARLIEGYGITECSPLVACNRPDNIHIGTIGQALPGVEVIIVDPETFEPRPVGQMGMALVHGPNVFHGYVGTEHKAPFHQINGKSYYVTGDLAKIDASGIITFSGRLKRFLKAGGEMISLPALEEPFLQKFPITDKGPQIAIEGVENDHGRKIVLFSINNLSLREANALLMENGFRGVMRLDDVVKMEAIPVLGTGKTDYKILRAKVVEMMG